MIQTQPRDQNVYAGSSASFSVTASGATPFQYQWFGPAAVLPNANSATLFLPQVDLPDAGNYYVKVSNTAGSTTSTSAVLTVTRADFGDAPSPYPTLLSADGARHTVVPGFYLGSQISFEPNGQPDPNANDDAGDDGVSFVTAAVRGQPCVIRVVASASGYLDGWIDFNANGSWSETTDQVFASVPLSAGPNLLTFGVPSTAVLGNTYARFRFSAQGGLRFTGPAPNGEVEDYALKIFVAAADIAVSAAVQPAAVPPNTVGHCALTVSNLGPNIASNVLATNFLAGVAILSVQGDGNCSVQPDTVVCSLGNIPAGSARKIFFDFSPMQQGLLNEQFVARSDTFDPVQANNRTGFVVRAAQPLVITKQPQGRRVLPGSDVSFFVEAQGVGALSYQWFMNGAAIPGETAQSLTLMSVQNSGSIQVQVSDAFGSVMSAVAALVVVAPAQIVAQPSPVFVSHGNSASFAVQVDGTPPFRFQWRLNGANIKGATNPVYVVDRVTKTNAGSYTVAVANDAGVISSRPTPLICTDILRLDPADNFGSAIQIPPAGVSPFQGEVQTSNSNATLESGEPPHAQKQGGASIWFKWTAPVSGIVSFDTIGSSFDTLLAVYTGPGFDNLIEVASDDDRGGYFTSAVRFNVTEGKTYLIAVDGLVARSGNVVLGWSLEQSTQILPVIVLPPKSVTALESNSVTLSVQVLGAAGANLFYQWIFNGKALQGANGPTFTIPALSPREVGNYWVLVRDANSDRIIESRQATVEIGPFPNIQSQDKVEDVVVNTTGGAGGAGLKATKSGGGFPPFISVALGIPGTQVMNNTNSTADIDCFDIGSASRWLGILTTNAPAGSILRIDSSGSAIPTEMAIYHFLDLACLQNTNCYPTNLMACDTNSAGGGGYSLLQVTPRSGGQYLVYADGLYGAEGFIRMNWQLGIPPVIIPAFSNCVLVCDAGTNIAISCGVTNASPAPSYQWFREGTSLVNETNSALSFTPIQSSNAASYSVIVSNTFGVVTNTCCVFVTPPLLHSQIAYSKGTPVTFSISSMLLPAFVLQSATNLSLPIQWENLFTNTTTNCNFLFVAPMADTNGILFPQRYYRVRKP